jgi:cold shock protein
MPQGTVKHYNDARGFGFITPDGGDRELFVHIKDCVDGIDELEQDQRVRFEIGRDRDGREKATAVEVIG